MLPLGVRAADAIPGSQLCVGEVSAITFAGNRVTRPEVMRRELPQRVGAPCSLDDVIDGLTALDDLGLFRSVRAEFHAGGGADVLELRYVVREKLFFLGLPRLSRTSDGEVRAGVGLEWNNFLGRLHELKLRSEWRQEDDGQGRGGFVHTLDYDVPRFFGSAYGMALRLGVADRQVGFGRDGVELGEGRLRARAVGLTLARWLNDSDGVQGLRLFFGTSIEHRDYTLLQGSSGTATDGVDLGWRIGLENRAVHRDRFRRRGWRYGGAFSFAESLLGSDFDWHRVDAWLAMYRPVGDGLDNLNLALGVGISDSAPYGGRFYAVGGGEVLRGVEKNAREGDVRFLLNVEYLRAVWSRPQLRWVVFMDVGNVWPVDAVDASDLLVRGGVGARWKLEALSRRDLRIDLAWDPERERIVPYLSTRLTF